MRKKVVRVIEYEGEADHVDATLARSLRGTIHHGDLRITGATLRGGSMVVEAALVPARLEPGVHLGAQQLPCDDLWGLPPEGKTEDTGTIYDSAEEP